MKKVLFAVVLFISVFSCSEDKTDLGYLQRTIDMLASSDTITPYFQNNPLPDDTDHLRILAIGNSYTEDGTEYIREILSGINNVVPDSAYCIYRLTAASASLEYWSDRNQNDVIDTIRHIAGGIKIPEEYGTLSELLSQSWDLVVLQQVSYKSVNFETYIPYLYILIDAIRENCPNKQVAIAWNMVHTYWEGYGNNNKPSGYKRWQALCNATKLMYYKTGIDIIIPTGTAIENARSSSLNSEHGLTRDGTHLAFGAGRYIATCTWIETLFAPVFGFSVFDSKYLHQLREWEERSKEYMYSDSYIPVTESNRELCQTCAVNACLYPYRVTYPGNNPFRNFSANNTTP